MCLGKFILGAPISQWLNNNNSRLRENPNILKFVQIYCQKMFNRKWSEEIAASFSFISSSVPTFVNVLILRFIPIIGTKYLMVRLHILPQEGTLVPIFVYFNSPIMKQQKFNTPQISLKNTLYGHPSGIDM